MPVISIINYKGGVGKTTLTANLGAELAKRGRSVLLIDLDPQASLTFSFVKPDYWASKLKDTKTIKQWFDSFSEDSGGRIDLESLIYVPRAVNRMIRNGRGGSLSLIPSHLGLINVDLELATELGGSSLAQSKKRYLKVHRRLADGLAREAFNDYDVVLIDCPPNFNVVTKTAIIASDHILVPAKADYLSTLGIDYLIRSLNELVANHNEFLSLNSEDGTEKINPDILGVVFTMVQYYNQVPIAALRQYISQASALKLKVFQSHIRENKSHFGRAAEESVPLVLDRYAVTQQLTAELRGLVNEFESLAGIKP
ncbi:ParA family protein [Rhodococcus qingshengii]|nr:hypothetical protein EN35_32765 [Rhodococcus qingshengii]